MSFLVPLLPTPQSIGVALAAVTMDPISAAGFASSIITFIDFSCKLVRGSIDSYHQAAGASSDNAQISSVVNDLKHATEAMALPPQQHGQAQSATGAHEKELRKLALECNAISKDLITVLEGLERKEGNKTWRSVEAAWKTLRKSKDVAAIEQRLSIYRVQILLRLNLILIENQNSVKAQLDDMKRGDSRLFSRSFDELSRVQQAIQNLESKLVAEASHSITIGSPGDSSLDEVRAQLTHVVHELEAVPKRASPDLHVLNRLHFGTIDSRVDGVHDAAFGTFSWLIDGFATESGTPGGDEDLDVDDSSNDAAEKESNKASPTVSLDMDARSRYHEQLRAWLQSGTGTFHVCGKAGSGKSTLMKLLCQSPTVKGRLGDWAGDKQLVLASFFFWNPGDVHQKSLEGLYRSLLFEVLRQCPRLTRVAFPGHWTASHDAQVNFGGVAWDRVPFRLPELRQAMRNLIESDSSFSAHRFCFFIDGLDEFQGDSIDHWELARQLRRWADNPDVKICASSRPHQEFLDVFDASKRMSLPKLTKPDISQFIHGMLDEAGVAHLHVPSHDLDGIVRSIEDRADGVFLWTRLVVRSLIEGIRHRYSPEALRKRILQTPVDLNSLFDHLFAKIAPGDRMRSDQMLLLALHDKSYINALMFSWLKDLDDPQFPFSAPVHGYSDEEILHRHEEVECQLKILCQGLLETYPRPGFDPYAGVRVGFFHRTVQDFLLQPEIYHGMQQRVASSFDVTSACQRLRLAEFKFAPRGCNVSLHTGFESLPRRPREPLQFPVDIVREYEKVVTQRQDGDLNISFLHWLAFYGQLDYLLECVGNAKRCYRRHRLCLLFTAAVGYGGPSFVEKLVKAGVVFGETAVMRAPPGRLLGRCIPGWAGFLLNLFQFLASGVPVDSVRWLVMEKLLPTKPTLDVHVEWARCDLPEKWEVSKPMSVSMSLEEVIVRVRPPNMDVLVGEIHRRRSWAAWGGQMATQGLRLWSRPAQTQVAAKRKSQVETSDDPYTNKARLGLTTEPFSVKSLRVGSECYHFEPFSSVSMYHTD